MLLGTPVVERDGARISFDTRKATALLAYLAMTGHPHSRDVLTALLWPDADRERARGALRRTRAVLNAATGGDCLVLDRQSVALRGDQVVLDVTEFERQAGDVGHPHPTGRACPRCVPPLAAAAALYRDDFLAGFSLRDSPEYDEWQAAEADRLRRRLADVLERLVLARVLAGHPGEALDEAHRWLALDPLQEPAHAVLMRLHAWTGRRSAALRQYRECVRVLDRELGVPPLSQTTALYDAIRTDRLPAPPARRAQGGAAVSAAARAESTPPGVAQPQPAPARLPLVGRRSEVALLRERAAPVEGSGRLVALVGEAGIGKTRLVAELVAAVAARGGMVASTRAHEGEQMIAFGVLTDLLRAASRDEPAALGRLPVAWQVELSRLLPEGPGLAGHLPAVPALDSPGGRSRLYGALVGALAALVGSRGSGLIVVEDVQWADESSAEVLAYLVRRLPDLPLLVTLSWRPEALAAQSPLRAALAEARRSGSLTTVEPARLDRAEVGELAQAALPALDPGAVDPGAVDRLHARTDGLPFFVTEYLEAFRRAGRMPADADWALPGGVRDLVEARLGVVSETTAQVLGAAAVLGDDIELDLLRSTSGRGEAELVSAVEEAVSRELLTELPADGDRAAYEFGHDALRQVVYDATSLARRRLLHGRAADALVLNRDADRQAATIARHLRRAGRDAEAADWSWRAAEHARGLYAHAEALGHLQAATALGRSGHLLHQVTGDVLMSLGRYADALAAYERAAAACVPDDEAELATIEHKLAEVHHRLGEWDVADSHLQSALALLADADEDALRARVLADRALVAHRRGNSALAGETAEAALQLADAAGDDAALAQAYDVLGVLASERGDLPGAAAYLADSLRHAQRLADPSARVAALNNLARVHAAAGRPADAVAAGTAALEGGLEHGDLHRAAALHTNLADLLHAAGDGEQAMEHLKAAARLFAGVDDEAQRRPEIWKLVQW
ncbi:MAG: AAA family ATPase [Mycobacteriales bacterium]